jgi:hypothetical protein
MKKARAAFSIALVCILCLSLFVPAFAAGGTITDLTAYGESDGFSVSGKANCDKVIIQIWDSAKTLMGMQTVSVSDGKFSETLLPQNPAAGSYTIKAADLEGGSYATATCKISYSDGGGGGGGGGTPVQPPVQVPGSVFTDVTGTDWFYSAVMYAYDNDLMDGVGGGKFDPNGTTTRAMLATILWRLAEEPSSVSSSFSDVPGGLWFSKAVGWAAANGIVTGKGGGIFDPDGVLTREQLVTMLYRYAVSMKYDTTFSGAAYSGFTDWPSVSGYASDAMKWAIANGILTGKPSGLLDPNGSATRAELATILQRFCVNIVGA